MGFNNSIAPDLNFNGGYREGLNDFNIPPNKYIYFP